MTAQINPLENEGNVAWALNSFPDLRLEDVGLPEALAPRGLAVRGLGEEEAVKVARFEGLTDINDMFTGFFIARFSKAAG